MPKSNHPRMLHSAVILGRLVVIYGGTSSDHTSAMMKQQCYSNEILAFDIGLYFSFYLYPRAKLHLSLTMEAREYITDRIPGVHN